MIILDERNYLRPELESKGFDVFDFFSDHQVMDLESFNKLELKRRGEFLLVDTQTLLNHPRELESFKSLLNTFLGAVFFHDHANQKAQHWVQDEGALLTKIIGEYSLPMAQLHWTILSNQLQFFWSLIQDQRKLQKHMAAFSLELDQVLQKAELEMGKAKEIHQSLVPRRQDEIRGVLFSNKYAVGEGGGSEFYSLHQNQSKVFQVLISSQSYLISSALLGLLAQYGEKDFDPGDFLAKAKVEIETINGAKKKKATVDLLVLELDLNTLELKSHRESKAELYSQMKGRIDLTEGVSHNLVKGEKLIVFSPGFLFNWSEGLPDKKIPDFLKSHEKLAPRELMPELFFQLEDGRKTESLRRDATVVMMEVNRHGIHKV